MTPGSAFTARSISYDVRITAPWATTATSPAGDSRERGGAAVGRPDGIWFGNINTNAADFANQMAFEVNGRMYTETATCRRERVRGRHAGGGRLCNGPSGHVLIARSDTPERHADNAYRSAPGATRTTTAAAATTATTTAPPTCATVSRTKVVAGTDGTYTMEGINYDGTDRTELGDTRHTHHARRDRTSPCHTIYRKTDHSGDQEY